MRGTPGQTHGLHSGLSKEAPKRKDCALRSRTPIPFQFESSQPCHQSPFLNEYSCEALICRPTFTTTGKSAEYRHFIRLDSASSSDIRQRCHHGSRNKTSNASDPRRRPSRKPPTLRGGTLRPLLQRCQEHLRKDIRPPAPQPTVADTPPCCCCPAFSVPSLLPFILRHTSPLARTSGPRPGLGCRRWSSATEPC